MEVMGVLLGEKKLNRIIISRTCCGVGVGVGRRALENNFGFFLGTFRLK
jgi:hypothetical protein